MPRFRPRVLAVLALGAAAALTLAACGGDDSSSTTSASSSSTSASTGAGAATVDLSDNAALGTEVLVDSQGRTLYLFEKDDEADESYCSGACAEAWPPLTSTGQAGAGDGLDASQLTTFEREDGDTQVAYAGHPLYLYAGDTAPGDANGNGVDQFGAEWYAMDASGDVVEGDESGSAAGEDSTSEDTTSEDSSGGYSY